jgi:hypothetical protein
MCGRDTKAADEVCFRCKGGGPDRAEEKGRSCRRWSSASDSPFDDQYEVDEYNRTAIEDYHGETIRDDL